MNFPSLLILLTCTVCAAAQDKSGLTMLSRVYGRNMPKWTNIHSRNLNVKLEQFPELRLKSGFSITTSREEKGHGGWIYPGLNFGSKPLDLSGATRLVFLVEGKSKTAPITLKVHVVDANGNAYYSPKGVKYSGGRKLIKYSLQDFQPKTKQVKAKTDWTKIVHMTFGYSIDPGLEPLAELKLAGLFTDKASGKAAAMDYNSIIFPGNINVFREGDKISFFSLSRGLIDIVNGPGDKIKSIELEPGKKIVPGSLPTGFYRIKSGEYGINYFTVVAQKSAYPSESGNIFCVDYGMATAPCWSKSEYIRSGKMAEMAGLKYVRERLNVVGIFNEHGFSDMKKSPWLNKTMSAYKSDTRSGLKVVAKFLETPRRLRQDKNIRKTPDDLFDFEKMLILLNKSLGKWVCDWEIFNEINLNNFYEGTAWEYAAIQKVAFLTLRRTAPGSLIIGPSFSQPAPTMRQCLTDNDMDKYYDVTNFHTYPDINTAYSYAADYIKDSDKLTGIAKPVWCTETGIETRGFKAKDGCPKALKRLRECAVSVGPLMTNIAASGTEKVFYFYWKSVFTFLCVLDRSFMSTECYAAIATLNRVLGGKYNGTLKTDNGITSHLFSTSKGAAVIVFAEKYPAKAKLKIQGKYKVISMTGETLLEKWAPSSGIVELKLHEPAYVKAEAFRDNYKSMRVKRSGTKKSGGISEIVMDIRFEANLKYNNSATAFEFKPGSSSKGTIYIYNFSDKEFTGQLKTTGLRDWKLEIGQTAITVPSRQRVGIGIKITAPDSIDKGIMLRGAEFKLSNSKGSKAHIRMGLDKASLNPKRQVKLFKSLKEMEWGVNKQNPIQNEFCKNLDDGSIWFKVDFMQNGHRMFWPGSVSFPGKLPLVDLSGYDAICFDVEIKAIKPGTWFMCTLTEQNGARYGSGERVYCNKPGFYKMVFPFSSFIYLSHKSAFDGPLFTLDTDKIKRIALGLNTNKKYIKNQSKKYKIEYIIKDISLVNF